MTADVLSFPEADHQDRPKPPDSRYAELQVTSNYSFLRGASHVEELLLAAKVLGHEALALTDRNTLAGVLRAHGRATELGMRLIVGCRLDLLDGTSLLVYPSDRPAYARLCRLLTAGKARGGKGRCFLDWVNVAAAAEGLVAILLPDGDAPDLDRLRLAFGKRAHLALTLRRRPGDAVRLRRLAERAQAARVATVVTGDVLYHEPGRRMLQDVMSCIREGCTVDDAGDRLERFADRHLRAPDEMARLHADHPEAFARAAALAEQLTFSLAELRYQYPDEAELPGETAQGALERHTWASIPGRYPKGLPPAVEKQLHHELRLIAQLQYAPYFLTVNTIVRQARHMGILCQGRGSRRQLRRMLRAGRHRHRPGRKQPAVRAVRVRRTAGAAGHRHRLRARAAGRDHPVDLQPLRPQPRRAVRHGRALPRPRSGARGGQGDGPDGGRDGRAGQPGLGLVGGRGGGAPCRAAQPQPRRP